MFCLLQDSEPSIEQVAQVKSKNTSPTSVLGLPLFRQPGEQAKRNEMMDDDKRFSIST